MVYLYTDATWKDLLTGSTTYSGDIGGTPVSTFNPTYDQIGNPLSWRCSMALSWSLARRLTGLAAPNLNASYTYNDSGIRTSKTVNGITTAYTLSGSRILRQTEGVTTLDFFYDEGGAPIGFKTGGVNYWYVFNLQGDVIGIINASGTQVVTYTYDAYGKPLSTTGSMAGSIGVQNPFRYRGYYYDSETGFYYLNSRYYDPTVGRFVNADSCIDNRWLNTQNLFQYCGNNPVCRADYNGHWVILVVAVVMLAAAAVTLTSCTPRPEPQILDDGRGGITARDRDYVSPETIVQNAQSNGGVVVFRGEVRVCTDGPGGSSTDDAYYYSGTAHPGPDGNGLDAREVPYIVMPIGCTDYELGDRAILINMETGETIECVVGDLGPSGNGFGEVSVYALQQTGFPDHTSGNWAPEFEDGNNYAIIIFPGEKNRLGF